MSLEISHLNSPKDFLSFARDYVRDTLGLLNPNDAENNKFVKEFKRLFSAYKEGISLEEFMQLGSKITQQLKLLDGSNIPKNEKLFIYHYLRSFLDSFVRYGDGQLLTLAKVLTSTLDGLINTNLSHIEESHVLMDIRSVNLKLESLRTLAEKFTQFFGKKYRHNFESLHIAVSLQGDLTYIDEKGKKWLIYISPFSIRTVGSSLNFSEILVTCDDNQGMSGIFEIDDFKIIKENGNRGILTFEEVTQHIRNNYALQVQDNTTLETFDLSRERPICMTSVFPVNYDKTLSNALLAPAYIKKGLEKGHTIIGGEIVFTDDPKIHFLSILSREYRKGIRDFFFCVNGHGDQNGIWFDSFGPSNMHQTPWFSRDAVSEIARKYPDCHITFYTNACYGGGFAPDRYSDFQRQDVLPSNANILLQTQYSTANIGGVPISYYDSFFVSDLLRGESVGRAIIHADSKLRSSVLGLDPQTIINGKLYTNTIETLPSVFGSV